MNKDGALTRVLWDSPAFKAGLSAGVRLIAVNGVAYDADRLRGIVKDSKERSAPICLLYTSDAADE